MASKKVVIDITARDKTKAGLAKSQSAIKSFAASMGPLIAAGFGVAAIKGATDAFIRQEQAVFQLEQRLKSTAGAAGKTSQELQATAAALQQITVFGDEATMEMQALLLTFTQIKGDQFDEATIAIQNVAAAMGTDLKSAALQVGKALNEPAGQLSALSRSGIQFTKIQKDMIKEMVKVGDVAGAQTIILKELETQFGGASGVHGLGGALKQLGNTFGDTLEIIGGAGGSEGFINLLKQVNLGLFGFNKLIDDIDGSTVSDALNGIALGFGAIRSAIESIPELPDWLTEAGSRAFRGALPLSIQLALALNDINEAAERANLPSSVTFPAPQRPRGIDARAATSTATQTVDGDLSGTGFFAPGFWEIQAQAQVDGQNILLESQIEFNLMRFEQDIIDGEQMQDMWLTNINERVEAELRGAEMIEAREGELAAYKNSVNQQTAANAINLINMLAGKSRAAAIAGVIIQKGIALSSAYTSTLAGANLAFASQLIPGDPTSLARAAAAKAFTLTQGYANMALIAASGFLQVAAGGGGAGGGGGSSTSPVITQPIDQDTETQQQITIIVKGLVDDAYLENSLVPGLNRLASRNVELEFVNA